MEYLEAELFDTVVGGGGTTDYEKLENKPMVNGVELVGDKSSEELGIATKTSGLTNDGDGESAFATEAYVHANGGKIDKIYLNGSEQAIVDKEVRLVVDKATVGLGNVDNTSDADKPVSTAVQSALDGKVDKVAGKQLSDENYTAGEKSKLGEIESGAQVNVLEGVQRNGVDLEIVGKKVNVSVPTKTSDISNDSGFIDKTVNNLDNYTTTTDLNTALGLKQDKTDNTLDTTSKTVVGAINEVNSLARGRTFTKEYNTINAMVTALNAMDADELKAGDNIYIVASVPDLWVAKVESTPSTYTYVDDATFIAAITEDLTTTVQVGYYRLCKLETEKVDLTNVVDSNSTITDSGSGNAVTGMNIDGSGNITLVKGLDAVPKTTTVAGVDLQDNITAAEMQGALTDTTHNFVTDTEKSTWSGKQDALVSGTNIKTINNESVLGSGDIEVGLPTLSGTSDPTTSTVGEVNQLYRNTTSNKIFICTAVTAQGTTPETYLYTWTEVGGGMDVLTGTSDPANNTVGQLGQIYIRTDKGTIWQCIQTGSTYKWINIGGGLYGYSAGGGSNSSGVTNSISIGKSSSILSDNCVAIGANSGAVNSGNTAIGYNAKANGAYNCIQLGNGTNTTGYTLQVASDNIYNHSSHTLTVQNITQNSTPVYGVLSGTTAPTTSTAGNVGQFYLDTATTKLYKCDAVTTVSDITTYTWTEVGGSVEIRDV